MARSQWAGIIDPAKMRLGDWRLRGGRLAARPQRRYGYGFIFNPGAIGSSTWLARNEERASRIAHGLVAANLGDPGGFYYKRRRRGNAEIDRALRIASLPPGETDR